MHRLFSQYKAPKQSASSNARRNWGNRVHRTLLLQKSSQMGRQQTMRYLMHVALRKNKLTILSLYKYKLSLTWKEITFKSSAGSRKMHDKSITALLLQKECSIWTYTPWFTATKKLLPVDCELPCGAVTTFHEIILCAAECVGLCCHHLSISSSVATFLSIRKLWAYVDLWNWVSICQAQKLSRQGRQRALLAISIRADCWNFIDDCVHHCSTLFPQNLDKL